MQFDTVLAVPGQWIDEDLACVLSAGKNIRQHDPIVVAVRFIAEHRDIELIRSAAGQHFLDSAGAGHAIAHYDEFHFRHLSAP